MLWNLHEAASIDSQLDPRCSRRTLFPDALRDDPPSWKGHISLFSSIRARQRAELACLILHWPAWAFGPFMALRAIISGLIVFGQKKLAAGYYCAYSRDAIMPLPPSRENAGSYPKRSRGTLSVEEHRKRFRDRFALPLPLLKGLSGQRCLQ
jgi:hypothetical protein